MDKFAARKGLPERVYVIHGTHKGRPWHAIIHSLHPDYDAAKEELPRLPADLAALNPGYAPCGEGPGYKVVKTGIEPSQVAAEVSESPQGPADSSAEQKTQTQVEKGPGQMTTQAAEVAAVSEGSDEDGIPAAQASSATDTTEQAPSEGEETEEAGDQPSGKTQHPDTEQKKDHAQDPAAPRSAPMATDAGSATPEVASATEVSAGTENTDGAQEQPEGDPPAVETPQVKSPEATESDVPTIAGGDAGAAEREKIHVVSENDYGLQLIGFFNRKTVDKFIAR